MRPLRSRRLSLVLTIVATACVALIGCGVSGKTSDLSSGSTTSTTEAPPVTTGSTATTGTVPDTGTTQTTAPDTGGGDTTIPPTSGGDGTTIPDTTVPFGTGDIRSTLIRIYKQSGFTDKEARCVADLIVKQSGGGTFDPSKLDVRKLGAAATKCFGADGVPGGSD